MAKPFNVNKLKDYFYLRNGQIWNSTKKIVEKSDILLKDGIIEKIGAVDNLPENTKVLDLNGSAVFPGLLDMHVHLREPGFEDKETIETGCAAAAAGGFTAVCSMPNTNPVTDNQETVRFILEKAENLLVNVYPIGAITKQSKGEELAEIGYMVQAGIVGISDDGMPVSNSQLMRYALEYSQKFKIPVIQHAQELSLTVNGSMNEGFYSTKLGLKGMPTIAEDIMVSRDIQLLEYTGGRLHVAHLSSADSVNLVRSAKAKGLKVTAEVTPHHLTLTDSLIETFDTNYKMNPPLRSESDIAALIAGLKDGTIDAIATDHAPHLFDDKDKEFDIAAFGVTGLETVVGLFFSVLVNKHRFTLENFVDFFVVNPRKILNIQIPEIKEGESAELSIINTEIDWEVNKDHFYSKAANSCYIGRKLRGKAIGTIANGKLWWQNEVIK